MYYDKKIAYIPKKGEAAYAASPIIIYILVFSCKKNDMSFYLHDNILLMFVVNRFFFETYACC